MGDFNIRPIRDAIDRKQMYAFAINDIKAFELMLERKQFNQGPPMIGAEQELCIVDRQLEPATSALKILDKINSPNYTNELALFNLEINLDPLPLTGNCFSKMEANLLALLQKGQIAAESLTHQLLLCGVLPTVQYRHLQFEYMTPIQRYQVLSKVLANIRGDHFEIYLQGVDELNMSLESVLFEACNTSFQMHLQIHPDEFISKYNWAQLIAGPVLATATNSPLLFGRELWAETRIALFKQSLDTRSAKNHMRKKLPRVYFGHDWLRESPAELWKNELMRFPLLLTSDNFTDSMRSVEREEVPDLRAIRLHNGTTYTWNRLCYGPSSPQPHLRIECRYLPAGPTPVDEIANLAFWTGLMEGQPADWKNFWHKLDFRIAKDNFIRAARTGLHTIVNWMGTPVAVKELVLGTLLPLAGTGLLKLKVDSADIDKYLSIIADRVEKGQTGTDWQIQHFRNHNQFQSKSLSLKALTQRMIDYQKANLPVAEWEILAEGNQQKQAFLLPDQSVLVEDLMSTDIFSLHEEDSIELARQMMTWKNIHHLPVENFKGELVGILTDGLLSRLAPAIDEALPLVGDIMIREVITADAKDDLTQAKAVMETHQLSCLPITYQYKLVGILTQNDLEQFYATQIKPKVLATNTD